MKLRRRQFLKLAATVAAVPAMPALARAQAFPSRTVTMVVPVPAGGALDTNARLVAAGMSAALGQTVSASTPDEFAELMRAEHERWGRVVKASGAKAD